MSDFAEAFIVDQSGEAHGTDAIVDKMQDLEKDDSVRVVSATQDVMACAADEAEVWRDWEGELIVQTPLKIYGDTPAEHRRDSIEWIGFGPIDIGVPGKAERERVNELHVM